MSIDESRSEIFRQLEDAVTRWGEQVSESHRGLAERIARTRALMDAALSGPGLVASGPSANEEAPAGPGAALDESLDRWTEALRENSQRLDALRAELAALREAQAAAVFPVSDGASLPPLPVNLEDLRGELSAMRHDLRILGVLTERVEEMRRLHEDWRQGEAAADPGAVAPPQASWTEVARLRAQLEDDLDTDPGGRFVSAGHIEELAYDEAGSRRRMGEILVEAGVITADQLRAALEEQERAPHRRLGFILVERGFTGETVIARVLASQLRTRFVELKDVHIDPGAAALISARMARHHQCIPIAATVDRLTLAMANPFDLIAVDDVELASRKQVETVVATATDIRTAVDRVFGPAS